MSITDDVKRNSFVSKSTSTQLDFFIKEATASLDNCLQRLQFVVPQEDEVDISSIHPLLHGVRSIRGSAELFNFTNIVRVTRMMERLLEQVENDQLIFSQSLIDRLLIGFEALQQLFEDVSVSDSIDVQDAMTALSAVESPEVDDAPPAYSAASTGSIPFDLSHYPEIVARAVQQNRAIYAIAIHPSILGEEQFESLRDLIDILMSVGTIVDTTPPIEEGLTLDTDSDAPIHLLFTSLLQKELLVSLSQLPDAWIVAIPVTEEMQETLSEVQTPPDDVPAMDVSDQNEDENDGKQLYQVTLEALKHLERGRTHLDQVEVEAPLNLIEFNLILQQVRAVRGSSEHFNLVNALSLSLVMEQLIDSVVDKSIPLNLKVVSALQGGFDDLIALFGNVGSINTFDVQRSVAGIENILQPVEDEQDSQFRQKPDEGASSRSETGAARQIFDLSNYPGTVQNAAARDLQFFSIEIILPNDPINRKVHYNYVCELLDPVAAIMDTRPEGLAQLDWSSYPDDRIYILVSSELTYPLLDKHLSLDDRHVEELYPSAEMWNVPEQEMEQDERAAEPESLYDEEYRPKRNMVGWFSFGAIAAGLVGLIWFYGDTISNFIDRGQSTEPLVVLNTPDAVGKNRPAVSKSGITAKQVDAVVQKPSNNKAIQKPSADTEPDSEQPQVALLSPDDDLSVDVTDAAVNDTQSIVDSQAVADDLQSAIEASMGQTPAEVEAIFADESSTLTAGESTLVAPYEQLQEPGFASEHASGSGDAATALQLSAENAAPQTVQVEQEHVDDRIALIDTAEQTELRGDVQRTESFLTDRQTGGSDPEAQSTDQFAEAKKTPEEILATYNNQFKHYNRLWRVPYRLSDSDGPTPIVAIRTDEKNNLIVDISAFIDRTFSAAGTTFTLTADNIADVRLFFQTESGQGYMYWFRSDGTARIPPEFWQAFIVVSDKWFSFSHVLRIQEDGILTIRDLSSTRVRAMLKYL
ncbi:MAG: hypothetical protein HQL54_05310 [Magnetococcales bacterium]|nr:hypothetical protein [Magnetococcales bacterium]